MKKLTTVLFFALLSTSLFAQTDKMRGQAKVFVEKINSEIISENPTLVLSDKQKAEIAEVMAQRSQAYNDVSKAEQDEAKRKEAQNEVVKPFNKKIFGELLSKEQKAALDTARNKAKAQK
jgi:hypothetical protein